MNVFTVALIDLDLAAERALVGDALGDGLAELVGAGDRPPVEGGRVAMDAEEISSRASRSPGYEVFDEAALRPLGQFASSSGHGS